MFYIAVYDSITELFKQALLVHHVMVLGALGSLTTTEAIEDLVREGRIPAAGTSDGHEDFAYAAIVFQDLREAIPFFDRLLVWLREVKLDDDVEMEKGEFMKQRGISISLVGSSKRSSDSTNINGNMGNLLLDHKLPDGTAANLVDPRNSRVLNGGYKSTVYAGLNAPPEHRRLWIEDPEGYRARFLARDPQLPGVVGLPGPVLMRACRLLLVVAGDGDGSSRGRKSVAGRKLVLHWRHILYVASLVTHSLSSTPTVGRSDKVIVESTTLHYDLVQIMKTFSAEAMEQLLAKYSRYIFGNEGIELRRDGDRASQRRRALFGLE
ncbi:hypothetical protein C356_02704 [Cryptococcus neoformans c45]|nr:hypothetical protein C356_02704 [Cryptococcus neoformans var. grubii c45]